MKIKKLWLFTIIGLLFLFPVVEAKDDIAIKDIEPYDVMDGVELNSYSKIDLGFNDLNQSVKYVVTLKNNTKRDLYTNSLEVTG